LEVYNDNFIADIALTPIEKTKLEAPIHTPNFKNGDDLSQTVVNAFDAINITSEIEEVRNIPKWPFCKTYDLNRCYPIPERYAQFSK
jgi:hypothetical protein